MPFSTMMKTVTATLVCSQCDVPQNTCPAECVRRWNENGKHDLARLECKESSVGEENHVRSFDWQALHLLNPDPRPQTLVADIQDARWDSFSYTTEDSTNSESFVKDIRIFTGVREEWHIARATFDTASTYNWISKSFVEERLGISISKIPAGIMRTCVAFSGHLVIPVGFVRLVWYKAEGTGRSTYETQFLVCDEENNLFDVVVGGRTIAREKILLWKVATIWSLGKEHHDIRMPTQSKKEREQEEARKEQTASANEEYQNKVKAVKAARSRRLALEAQNGSLQTSRDTPSLRQEDQTPQFFVALQRLQQTEKRTDKIRSDYGKGKEIVPSPAGTTRSEASKAAGESWRGRFPDIRGPQASGSGGGPSRDLSGGAWQSSSANLGRTDVQVAGPSGEPRNSNSPPTSPGQRGSGTGNIGPGGSMGHLSADPVTRSTDESRNATSTPATSTEARASDQEEHHTSGAIGQEVPSNRRRWYRQIWGRMRPRQNRAA